MPLILGTNSIKDTSYDVANSLRFHGGNDDSLNKTLGTPTNNLKWSISFWIKRTELGAEDAIITASTNSQNRGMLLFRTDDTLDILDLQSDSFVMQKKTNRKFRDPNAWYSILITSDATLSSPATKIYVNGVEETSFATSNEYSQNQANKWNSAISHHIGNDSSTRDFSGYLAEFVFVDGQVLNPTDIGEFDSDSPNIWKPKDVSGLTFGNNGFHLDFENASSLGADVSGNSNNFTVNNLTSLDQTTDTCTNNFATIDTLSTNLFDPATTTFSEGNLKYVASNANFNGTWLSNIGVNAGKWYAEFKLGSHSTNSGHSFGIYRYDDTGVNATGGDVPVSNMIRIIFADSSRNVIAFGSTVQTGLSSTSSGDIFGIYMDIDNGKLNVQKNGSDYITEITGITTAGSTFFFQTQGEVQSRNLTFEHNYGNPTFSISSGNSDPEGFGNFEFSTTHNSVDYFALCTKNLAEYG